jgi:dihydroorotate dehydrogenase (NAD+) catalytic subunit
MDEDSGSMKRILQSGAGAVVTKSIGLTPKQGYVNPTFVKLDHGILNAMGLPNPGIKNFKEEIKNIKNKNNTIICSIFGGNTNDFIKLAGELKNTDVDALELNLSCPHAKKYGLEIGNDPDLVKNICKETKKVFKKNVFAKISPNLTDIVTIAKSAEKGGADAIVAINTVKAMKIDLETQKPVLSNKIGGYSGPAIKPIGVRCVYELYDNIKIPIIGCGGITYGHDAIEYFLAGAQAVEIGSAIYYRDVEVFKKINHEIIKWLKNHNYTSLKEIIGAGHQ